MFHPFSPVKIHLKTSRCCFLHCSLLVDVIVKELDVFKYSVPAVIPEIDILNIHVSYINIYNITVIKLSMYMEKSQAKRLNAGLFV